MMNKFRKILDFLRETYPKWKAVESKRIKILSLLGLLFPFILSGAYYTMKIFFPKYLMFLFIALMPACQSIDSRLLEDLERQNHEIIQAHLKDNYDNPLFVEARIKKGSEYIVELLNGLLAPERAQLRTIYEFWKKEQKEFQKQAEVVVLQIIKEFDDKWQKKRQEEELREKEE